MRRLFAIAAVVSLFGAAGCCHNTCDSCHQDACPACTQGHVMGRMAPQAVTQAPATTTTTVAMPTK